MPRSNFAAFILTHGRADNVRTYHALRKCGYSGRIYLLVDDEDKQLPRYLELYKDEVIVFPKQAAIDMTDSGDNSGRRNSVVFARNYNFQVAKQLGLTHFWQLDDDYSQFGWTMNNQLDYITAGVVTKRLDDMIEACLNFLDDIGAHSVAFAQGGDFIGGGEGRAFRRMRQNKLFRKVMNSFFFRTDRPVSFKGVGNDDVNMYVEGGIRGKVFSTIPRLRLWQGQTQLNSGGLTDMYLDAGTYVKSFYTVMIAPSCVRVCRMISKNRRIHHAIKWADAVPVIIDEKYRKALPGGD